MVKMKEMPSDEKYQLLVDSIKFDKTFIPVFVKEHLGEAALEELHSLWREGTKQVPENLTIEEKYEAEYANWISIARSSFTFIRQKLGEEGLEKLQRVEVDELKRKNASPALLLLKVIRAFAPGSAFNTVMKQMIYQLQWLCPYSVNVMTKDKVVLGVPNCKILDFPDVEDICLIGCQQTYPRWMSEQFKVVMQAERQGKNCTLTFTPLR